MQNKKIITFSLILIACFLTPLLLTSIFSSTPIEVGETYKAMWIEGMPSYVNIETVEIIINNTMVILIMCLFSIIPFTLYNNKERKTGDLKRVVWLVTVAYALYFAKEGIRAGLGLLDFPYVSYLFGVFILTLPHGIIEITGFAIASSATLSYHKSEIDKKVMYQYLLLAVGLIVVAGLLETTLTPYLFRIFV